MESTAKLLLNCIVNKLQTCLRKELVKGYHSEAKWFLLCDAAAKLHRAFTDEPLWEDALVALDDVLVGEFAKLDDHVYRLKNLLVDHDLVNTLLD